MIHQFDPHRRVRRALTASAARHRVSLGTIAIDERPWSSATFNGCRLRIALAFDDGDPAAWLAALPEEDMSVPGHLVADIVVVSVDPAGAALEVLLLEA